MSFQRIVEWFREFNYAKQDDCKQTEQGGDATNSKTFGCVHGGDRHDFCATVLGVECKLVNPPKCQTCAEEYLNKFSTLCHSCKRPIFPGERVALSGSQPTYTHVEEGAGGLYCGQWGEGQLITLHELNPAKYPEGTSCMAVHAFTSGEAVIESF